MFKKLFGFLDLNKKEVERLDKIAQEINNLEPKYKNLKITDLKKYTEKFKKQVEGGKSLENLLPDAYSLVRQASFLTLGQRHYDVQIMSAIALFEGKVVEQKTGEGKTLSAVPALYLRALTGKGSHLVTVNDYLARVGAGWNGPIFDNLGLTVGVLVQEGKSYIYDPGFTDDSHGDERLAHLKPATRKQAYGADITYGTNNEFGFDYLRDNMVQAESEMAQRGHYFSIVDEVDSILIDEARTPLIISAPDTEPTKKYYEFAKLIAKLSEETDFKIDEKSKSATLTESGITKVEKILGVDNLYEKDFRSIHHIENALRARSIYLKDRDYVVKDGSVTIVDEFTGRLMVGRRWSDGLHQSVEAKEGVVIQQESKTLATISFQNYFRLYEHLSGMTGTAATEAEEFKKIYDLDVVAVPTNQPLVRKDLPDSIYKNINAKYTAIVEEIADKHKKGQPVLVGTTSIEKNEIIAQYLKRKKVPHNVLNAKKHEKEAFIIADAGKPGAVTVATNMAGRGVDIILGGADGKQRKQVIKAGGLHVVGTERHESRRIDNQLRGRAGRQGDAGSSRFFLSLEDDLMRIFGGEQIKGLMDKLSIPDDQPIENSLVSKAIEQSQVKVEGFHFDTRKRLVEFDDVANQQREIVYKLRRKVLSGDNLKDEILDKLTTRMEQIADLEDKEMLLGEFLEIVPFDDKSMKNFKTEMKKHDEPEKLKQVLTKVVTDAHSSREKQVGVDVMRRIEKYAYLGSIDHLWIDHIDTVDDLREAVGLRAYGQRDPLVEFKAEAYGMFETLLSRIDQELNRRIFRVGVHQRPSEIPLDLARENIDKTDMTGLSGNADTTAVSGEPAFAKASSGKPAFKQAKSKKIGRNDPCWCGSGKKYKKCHYPQLG
ncbi:SEC-C domain-containing protein [Candidatus Microgenomates bacterium]|nr:SEC-C domain-containing protein [Candidatus Microgenomates bacterium]